jgi:hypothetical protein
VTAKSKDDQVFWTSEDDQAFRKNWERLTEEEKTRERAAMAAIFKIRERTPEEKRIDEEQSHLRHIRELLQRATKHFSLADLKLPMNALGQFGQMDLKQKRLFGSILTKALKAVAAEDDLSEEDTAIMLTCVGITMDEMMQQAEEPVLKRGRQQEQNRKRATDTRAQWGTEEQRIAAVQRFFNSKYKKLHVTALIDAAVKDRKVSRSFINRHRRHKDPDKRLTIPPRP